jgi:predicted glycoside hydrolase/deacetylase ChbG (UPF0249 family)
MKTKYLIVNADDAGLSPEVDRGIAEVIEAGVVTSLSLLVNPPFPAALQTMAGRGVSIGLHLNLTLGYPCSPSPPPALVDPDGRFRRDGCTNPAVFEATPVRTEFLCQLRRFRELTGCEPTHLDVHKHLHSRSTAILSAAMEIATALTIPLRCPDGAMRRACRSAGIITTDLFIGDVVPSPYWTPERLKSVLNRIPGGITEMMCHPGKDMKPMEGVAYVEERDTERRTLTSPEAKQSFAPFRLAGFSRAPFEKSPAGKAASEADR